MSKIAQHLRKHLHGEVIASKNALEYFSTDGSVFEVTPQVVTYPENTTDVRKIARFCWQLAERGNRLPITARGKGTDQGGAALGEGVVIVFPAHMNKLLELDARKNFVRIQPGINYRNLQDTLKTHRRFLPPYPSSVDISTVGGAIANDACGERTIKYGCTKDYTLGLDVVLANGDIISTRRLSNRELSAKQGLSTFEGQIYRELDGLLEDNMALIENSQPEVSKNSAGYNLQDIKRKDGSFDLTPLIVGSQGTLGIVTEATMKVVPNNSHRTLVVGHINDPADLAKVVPAILKLRPAALELVDKNLLEFVHKHTPHQLTGLIEEPFPPLVLLVEYDDRTRLDEHGKLVQKKKAAKTVKMLSHLTKNIQVTDNYNERERLWKLRHSAAAVISHVEGTKKALPIIEDGVVPLENLPKFLDEAYKLFERHHLEIAIWGHAGNANFHMQPFLDLSTTGDRQLVFKIMDEFYAMVLSLGGSTAGEHNDGRLRAPYLKDVYGDQMYDVFKKVKQIFDPFNILNPGVKIDVSREDIVPLLRQEYSMDHLYDHLPRGV